MLSVLKSTMENIQLTIIHPINSFRTEIDVAELNICQWNPTNYHISL